MGVTEQLIYPSGGPPPRMPSAKRLASLPPLRFLSSTFWKVVDRVAEVMIGVEVESAVEKAHEASLVEAVYAAEPALAPEPDEEPS